MAFIEPGTKFTIEYGNGREIEVIALAGRKQRQLADVIREIAKTESKSGLEAFDMFEQVEDALALCVGKEEAARLFDADVDAELAMDIASKTLGKQALSEEDRKKSESPH